MANVGRSCTPLKAHIGSTPLDLRKRGEHPAKAVLDSDGFPTLDAQSVSRGVCQLRSQSLLTVNIPVLGQEFQQTGLRHGDDAIKEIGKSGLGGDVVELGGTDQMYITAARSSPQSEPAKSQDLRPRQAA